MDKQGTTQPHAHIGTILYVDLAKPNLTTAISKYLSINGCLDFDSLNIRTFNEFNDIGICQEKIKQCSKNIMIKSKKINHSNRNIKKQK